jgi:Uma2 family endonuclease
MSIRRFGMAVKLSRRRFTVTEYHRMAQAGILGEDDRIELIEGEIIEMSPIGTWHAGISIRLNELFMRTFGNDALVSVQNPIQLSDDTEPQPDVTLLRRRNDYYASHRPDSEDVLLVVEIADTSVAYDRQVKSRLYAQSGIAEYWLIDLNAETVTEYRDAGPDGYGITRVLRRGEQVTPAAFPNRSVTVDSMLG